MRAPSVFHLAHRPPARVERIARMQPLPPSDPPPRAAPSGAVLPKGQGPWQVKALELKNRESLVLSRRDAEAFRGACRRLGIRTETRSQAGMTQVWVFKENP